MFKLGLENEMSSQTFYIIWPFILRNPNGQRLVLVFCHEDVHLK